MQALALEQQRRAVLEQQLTEREHEVQELQGQVQQLRGRQEELQTALKESGGGTEKTEGDGTAAQRAYQPGDIAWGPGDVEPRGDVVPASAIVSLRTALSEEQQRRVEVETELARLKEETSAPAFGDARVPEADFLAVKQEIVDLRKELADERQTRERMAEELRALQQGGVPQTATAEPEAGPEAAELRARLESLQQEKQALIDSLNRNLAASQQRAAELETQLAAAQSAAAIVPASVTTTDPDTAAIRVENAKLRTQLDDERRHTEDLAAKLRVATRVTDLIFKMQAQQSRTQPRRRQR